ncbi:MAG: hypothetical protein H6855_07515 [Rhodospirillales bacterium]|nr:hypothetical protein [Rhodospirillales bacterium]
MRPDIPYYANPDHTHCMQACLRMGYEYFTPEKKWLWEELDLLTGHKPELTTWTMKSYIETERLGYDVVIYDPLDYVQFAAAPKEYIEEKFSPAYAEETFKMSDMDQADFVASQLD